MEKVICCNVCGSDVSDEGYVGGGYDCRQCNAILSEDQVVELEIDADRDENFHVHVREAWEAIEEEMFYYEWGNEPAGMVSLGTYVNDVFKSLGHIHKDEVIRRKIPFRNPHS